MYEIIDYIAGSSDVSVLTIEMLARFYVFLFLTFMATNIINCLLSNARKV